MATGDRDPTAGGEVGAAELRWIAEELGGLRSKVDEIEAGLNHQRSAFIDIAGARTLELRDALEQVQRVAADLQRQTQGLHDLQEAVAERLFDVVGDNLRPQLTQALAGQLPHLVVEAVSPDIRQALKDWLPTFVVEAIKPEIRKHLDDQIPLLASEMLIPELRRLLSDRLPQLVVEAVRPEVRNTLGDRLPTIVAQVVSPEVGALLAERLPTMLVEAINPDMSASLAEIEGGAAELRAEASKMRGLRELIAERLPQAAMVAVEPHLREALVGRFPTELSQTLAGPLSEALAGHVPALLASAVSPAFWQEMASQLPERIVESVQPQLREALVEAMADRMPAMIGGVVGPELRTALETTIPAILAGSLTETLASVVRDELPAVVSAALGPDVSVSLTDVEAAAAAMREETGRFRNLREMLSERMPEALVSSVQPIFEDLLGVRLPAMMQEVLTPALDEALVGQVVERMVAAIGADRDPSGAAVTPALESALLALREEAARLRELREDLAHQLPALVTTAVRAELAVQEGTAAPPAPAARTRATRDTTTKAADADGGDDTKTPGQPRPLFGMADTDTPAPALPEAAEGEGDEAGTGAEEGAAPVGGGDRPASTPAVATPAGAATAKLEPGGGAAAAEATKEADAEIACQLDGLAIAPSLAEAVGSALARARLRRRRRRQAGPPAAGLYRYDPHASATIRSIERFALARRATPPDSLPAVPELGDVVVGEQGGREVRLQIGLGGACLVGPRCRDVARSVVTTLVATNPPEAVQCLVIGELLPTSTTFPGLMRSRDVASILDDLEAEAEERRELFAQAGATDLAGYRVKRPDAPVPLLVVVTSELSEADEDRFSAALSDGSTTGMVPLLVDVASEGLTEVRIGPGLTVVSVSDPPADDLVGARLFAVDREPVSDVLAVFADARTDPQAADALTEPPDVPFPVTAVEAPVIDVRLLGAYRIEADGREVRSGLRAKARELLAFYLLHPEGTTLEEATQALWPEADAGRGSEWFWTALGNLRSRLRTATGQPDLKVIEREDDRYRIEAVFSVDLWRFQTALGEASTASGDPEWATTLEETAALYGGPLLSTADWGWVDVPRDDLRRRLVDVLVSLAATRLVAGDVKGALHSLQQAVEADPLAEQLYRRIMRLQAKMARLDDAEATYRTLQNRLAEIGLDPAPESETLHREITTAD